MALDDARHPDAERLAEYAEGGLDVAARAEVERHLAECAECRSVVMETLAFLESSEAAEATTPAVIPFRPRKPWIAVAAGLAAAAAIVFAVRLDWLSGGRGDRPELQELIAAVAQEPTRPVEGRLSGGFKYGPPPSPTRGAGGREASPDVRIAAAKIEKLARQEDTPDHEAAVGAAALTLGDFDKAVQSLESAAQRSVADAHVQNDLSAAYLARARWLGRADDIPRALAAAGRSIGLDARLTEAYFNRALALEELHLDAEAVRAFEAFRRLDPASPWAAEAQRHEERLKRPAGDKGAAAINLQQDRERLEDDRLPGWGRLQASNDHAGAGAELSEIASAADALAAGGGDTMVRDEVRLIRSSESSGNAKTVAALARAHVKFGEARRAFRADNLRLAADTFSAASVDFSMAGSPYAVWGAVYRAIGLWVGGSGEASLAELPPRFLDRVPTSYVHLRGRVAWTRAMAFETLGRWDVARSHLRDAVEIFQRGSELDYLAANQTYLASADWLMGDKRAAWAHEISALEHASRAQPGARRDATLRDGGIYALGDGLPEAALPFHDTLVNALDAAAAPASPLNAGMAHLRRAEIRARLGRFTDGADDLSRAEREFATVRDPNLGAWMNAELSRVRARSMYLQQPSVPLPALDASLDFYRRTMSAARLSELLLLRARSLEARHDNAGAEREFLASVEAFEHDRSRLSPQDRVQAFQQQREAFRELVRFEGVVLKDDAKALSMAERGRRGAPAGVDTALETADVPALIAQLPQDVALICYTALPDRVMVWVLTAGHRAYFERPIAADALARSVARIRQEIAQGADVARLRPLTATLYRDLVAPALSIAGSKSRLVFIPDGPLAGLPFGALPDLDGNPLVVSHVVAMAPSISAVVAASRRLIGFVPGSVLAIGDGHQPTAALPRLPFADREAETVGTLYPRATVLTGAAAAKARFIAARDEVIHFAGHTVVNADLPLFSRLLFAPDAVTGDTGALLGSELQPAGLAHTGVVVLATCNGAAGRVVDGEGMVSVARLFLDAGVPSVIASLWPVDDGHDEIMLDFHRALAAGHDPAAALRRAQLASLRLQPAGKPIREWGAYVALGGVGRPESN